jgi:hypothetical protein
VSSSWKGGRLAADHSPNCRAEELGLEFGNRRSLPVPGTTSIFLHSRIPKGMMGNCDQKPTPEMERKKQKRKTVFGFEGSVNGRSVGEKLVYKDQAGS